MDMMNWLLESEAPGVAYPVRSRLLCEDNDSRRMKSPRGRCNNYEPVARMLDRVNEAIAARGYQKYECGALAASTGASRVA